MRQIRVTNQSCLIPEDFKEAIKVTRYILICSSDGFTNSDFFFTKFAAWFDFLKRDIFWESKYTKKNAKITIYSCQKSQKTNSKKNPIANRQFRIRENKIHETISLAVYMSQIKAYLSLYGISSKKSYLWSEDPFSRSLKHKSFVQTIIKMLQIL